MVVTLLLFSLKGPLMRDTGCNGLPILLQLRTPGRLGSHALYKGKLRPMRPRLAIYLKSLSQPPERDTNYAQCSPLASRRLNGPSLLVAIDGFLNGQ
jgi:hypothetical protein